MRVSPPCEDGTRLWTRKKDPPSVLILSQFIRLINGAREPHEERKPIFQVAKNVLALFRKKQRTRLWSSLLCL